MTDAEMQVYSRDHLYYEVWMLHETASRLLQHRGLHEDRALKNGVVESFTIHARALTLFVYPEQTHKRAGDVVAADYIIDIPGWDRARGAISPILTNVIWRTGKEIAHLTTNRLDYGHPDKDWPLVSIVDALRTVLGLFVAHAVPQRLDSFVAGYLRALRTPVGTARPQVYNSTSTGPSTVSGPGPSFTDIRTL